MSYTFTNDDGSEKEIPSYDGRLFNLSPKDRPTLQFKYFK